MRVCFKCAVIASMLIAHVPAHAVIMGFVSNPTTNSSDWATEVGNLGGLINSNVNFDTMALGALTGGHYSGSDGVTLSGTNLGNVTSGAGPGQANTSSTPLSSGEGVHAASHHLFVGGGTTSTLTIDFSTPVLGAGLGIIDLFDPQSSVVTSISAYAGANGTGALLGSFSNAEFNFQMNHIYFMGITDSNAGIRSLVWSHNGDLADAVGIDDIVFATNSVPEPATLALAGLALAGLVFQRRSKAA